MESCVARQPIFNNNMEIFGYELLYRHDNKSTAFQGEVSQDTATTETIVNSFHSIGIHKITNGKYAFVNFTEKLLLSQIATLLPSSLLIIEILENISPTEEVLEACQTLRKKGYRLALDDFVFKPQYEKFLSVAGIVKIDFRNTPLEEIKITMSEAKKHQIIFLAEKLETLEDYELAKSMGFSLFQGFFFSKPRIVNAATTLAPNLLLRLQLVKLAFDPNVNYRKIAEIIKHDTALTYRLFRVVNSVFFGLDYKVSNIRQALSILGMDEIKKWITLISLSQIGNNKPSELITMSLIRGRSMELIAPKAGLASRAEDMFIVGLMSLMDAITDTSMQEIILLTSISPSIAEPLLYGTGIIGDILTSIIHYENSRWAKAQELAAKYCVSLNDISKAYLQAIEWSNNF